MTVVSYIPGSPNPFAATFEIDRDVLGGRFSKIAIPRMGSGILKYSPLAQAIFSKSAGYARVDLALTDKGKTRVTITRKFVHWDERKHIPDTTAAIEKFMAGSQQAVLAEALAQNVDVQRPFRPNGKILTMVHQAFIDQVTPVLASHGGAMELLDVKLDQSTGKISAEVALIGNCNGCGSAEEQTLGNATKAISDVIDVASKRDTEFQGKSFAGIRTREIQSLVIGR